MWAREEGSDDSGRSRVIHAVMDYNNFVLKFTKGTIVVVCAMTVTAAVPTMVVKQ